MYRWLLVGLCLAVALLHGLPHILIPLHLSSGERYTPFAVNGVSGVTFDESYIYAAQTNYTATRGKPAYDTDVYEYRDVPAVFPYVPFYALAALARLTGGTANAFIVCDFLLPPLAFLLVWRLIAGCVHSEALGALGALATILISFGPRNFLVLGKDAIQPLEYSRLLHPELSFTLFLLALWLLRLAVSQPSLLAVNRPSTQLLVANGVAGGLLFYVYAYYWPAWFGACALLCILAVRRLWISLLTGALVGSFFWLNVLEAQRFPNYVWRIARFEIEHGHIPYTPKLVYTAAVIAVFAVLLAVRKYFGEPADWRTVALFWSSIFVAACCGLNEEIVTGVNVESMAHYPNRVFQPLLFMAFFALAGPALRRLLPGKWWHPAVLAGIVFLVGIAAVRQVSVAANTAPKHVYTAEEQSLFGWLNSHTPVDSVVLLSVNELAQLLPAFTHNFQFIPNGTRTTASNEEILERFLAGEKLLGHSEEWVRAALAQDYDAGDQPLGITYVYYLFQGHYDSADRRLGDPAIDAALGKLRAMDLKDELSRFRLDYIYARGSEQPVVVSGYAFREAFHNPYGTVYRITRRN